MSKPHAGSSKELPILDMTARALDSTVPDGTVLDGTVIGHAATFAGEPPGSLHARRARWTSRIPS